MKRPFMFFASPVSQPISQSPKLIFASGADEEWGRMIGEAEADRIRIAQECLAELPLFLMHKPWWMPFRVYLSCAEKVAQRIIQNPISRVYPRIRSRLKGMAAGAGVRMESLCLFHMLEAASSQQCDPLGANAPPTGGCSAIGIGADRIREGEPTILHNLDQVKQATRCLTVRKGGVDGELRSICLTLAPLCGVVDGINEAGLAISYNYAAAIEIDSEGTPLSLAISDALAGCRTVPEAIGRLVRRNRSHGAILMIADATGCLARLELSGRHYHIDWLTDPGGILFHTNAYRSEKMSGFQVDQGAVYRDSCPPPLRGVRILESSERRDAQIHARLQQIDDLQIDSALELLKDHGDAGEPDGNTVCMHGAYWSTVASVQMLPKSRVFRVSYGPACCADYRDFTF